MTTGKCDECQTTYTCSSAIEVDIARTTPEKLLEEVNEKLAIVFVMKKTLESMSEDISFYAEKYQELIMEKEKTDKKIKSLENKNVHLETVNKALEERITYLEIREREKNVEIFGVPLPSTSTGEGGFAACRNRCELHPDNGEPRLGIDTELTHFDIVNESAKKIQQPASPSIVSAVSTESLIQHTPREAHEEAQAETQLGSPIKALTGPSYGRHGPREVSVAAAKIEQ
ncbi:unnamed protein product [Chrysodeixis includens]|uniref:Uncharacterized protein n=1 Tax=Chrysodeixis includens TaxID=689277 RepID=A0A9P0E6G8_CHRIL|nr:unnamed protein product [Chrysodeixis includens]